MFIGACLFVLMFIMIAPGPQAFLLASATGASHWLLSWAPFSFILLAMLVAAPVVSIYLMKTWPVQEEPENPMAKYRRDDVDTGD